MRQGDPSRFVPELAVAANPFAWLRHLYYRWGLMLFCRTAGLGASLRGARRARGPERRPRQRPAGPMRKNFTYRK